MNTLLLLLLVLASQAAEQRMTIGSGVRARAKPNASAAEVVRLPIGTVLTVKERTEAADWYRVELAKGATGWVSASLLTTVDPAKVTDAQLALWRERSKVDATPFADRADLADMLERAVPAATSKEQAAELDFARWLALDWTRDKLPFEHLKEEPYATWIKRRGDLLVYSEPAGEWFMNASKAWALEEKHRGLPIADEIAWTAARTPPPGECEGYFPCYLSVLLGSEGRYLERYPKGKHVEEALARAMELLSVDGDGGMAPEDKQSAREQLAKFRATLSQLDPSQAKAALAKLAALEKAMR